MSSLPPKSPKDSSDLEGVGAFRYFGGYDDKIDYFNGDNEDKYYFTEDPDPLNELISKKPEDYEYYDDDTPFFRLKSAGIYLEPQVVLRVMSVAGGEGGYFQHLGQVEGTGSTRALEIAKGEIDDISRMLKPILTRWGVPEEEQAGEVDMIMSELRGLYSGTQAKRDLWKKDRETLIEDANNKLREKKLDQSLGSAALSEDQLPRQLPIEGFDEAKAA